jgi:hypothetical protein
MHGPGVSLGSLPITRHGRGREGLRRYGRVAPLAASAGTSAAPENAIERTAYRAGPPPGSPMIFLLERSSSFLDLRW